MGRKRNGNINGNANAYGGGSELGRREDGECKIGAGQ